MTFNCNRKHAFYTICGYISLTLLVSETKIAEFADSIALDEVAHNVPPHLDLHCLPFSFFGFFFLNII